MATSDQEQKSVQVPQHKRMAMGEKLDGQSMKGITTAHHGEHAVLRTRLAARDRRVNKVQT